MKRVLKFLLLYGSMFCVVTFAKYFYQEYDHISVIIGIFIACLFQAIDKSIKIKGNCCICNNKIKDKSIKEKNKIYCSLTCFKQKDND